METRERLLPIVDVMRSIGFGRNWIYSRMREGTFPRPVRIGPQAVRWKMSDVDRWIAERSQAASPTYQ